MEAQCLEVDEQAGLGEVVGDHLRSGRQRGLHPGLRLEAECRRLAGEQAGADQHGVVEKFVEYFGDGLANLPLADRATIANMAPEYGATCGIFPVDEETLNYLRLTGRSDEQVELCLLYTSPSPRD